jgi:hypothetical protein
MPFERPQFAAIGRSSRLNALPDRTASSLSSIWAANRCAKLRSLGWRRRDAMGSTGGAMGEMEMPMPGLNSGDKSRFVVYQATSPRKPCGVGLKDERSRLAAPASLR